MGGGIGIRVLHGRDAALGDCLGDLARLRIEVFRDFPYLYDGDLAYEMHYLGTYTRSPDSIVVLAEDDGTIVGASTGLPLADETPEFQRPFLAAGLDPATIFYGGESVLLAAYRGRGVYREFFAAREGHARALERFSRMVFCAVVRSPDHPRQPPDYVPLDAVWRRFGYRCRDDLVTTFEWRDLDEAVASAKGMVFWEKAL